MTDSNSERILKESDYQVNLVANLRQDRPDRSTVLERYRQGNALIHLHAWVGTGRGDVVPSPFCAHLQRVEKEMLDARDNAVQVISSRTSVPLVVAAPIWKIRCLSVLVRFWRMARGWLGAKFPRWYGCNLSMIVRWAALRSAILSFLNFSGSVAMGNSVFRLGSLVMPWLFKFKPANSQVR